MPYFNLLTHYATQQGKASELQPARPSASLHFQKKCIRTRFAMDLLFGPLFIRRGAIVCGITSASHRGIENRFIDEQYIVLRAQSCGDTLGYKRNITEISGGLCNELADA
jgi:hypothetical protein